MLENEYEEKKFDISHIIHSLQGDELNKKKDELFNYILLQNIFFAFRMLQEDYPKEQAATFTIENVAVKPYDEAKRDEDLGQPKAEQPTVEQQKSEKENLLHDQQDIEFDKIEKLVYIYVLNTGFIEKIEDLNNKTSAEFINENLLKLIRENKYIYDVQELSKLKEDNTRKYDEIIQEIDGLKGDELNEKIIQLNNNILLEAIYFAFDMLKNEDERKVAETLRHPSSRFKSYDDIIKELGQKHVQQEPEKKRLDEERERERKRLEEERERKRLDEERERKRLEQEETERKRIEESKKRSEEVKKILEEAKRVREEIEKKREQDKIKREQEETEREIERKTKLQKLLEDARKITGGGLREQRKNKEKKVKTHRNFEQITEYYNFVENPFD